MGGIVESSPRLMESATTYTWLTAHDLPNNVSNGASTFLCTLMHTWLYLTLDSRQVMVCIVVQTVW